MVEGSKRWHQGTCTQHGGLEANMRIKLGHKGSVMRRECGQTLGRVRVRTVVNY